MTDGTGLQPLKDLLGSVARRLGADADAGTVAAMWREIVGTEIAAHAEPTSLRGGVLRVRAESPVWTTELAYLRDEIRARSNHVVGRNVVTEVRVWTGPGRPVGVGSNRLPDRPQEAAVDDDPPDPYEALSRARRAWRRARNEPPNPDESAGRW
jgi:hypothetical protein